MKKELKKLTKLNFDGYSEYLESFSDDHGMTQFHKDGWYHYRFFFKNGYIVSVIKHWGSYGYEQDLFEVAVFLPGGGMEDEPQGYLTNDGVLKILERVKNYEI